MNHKMIVDILMTVSLLLLMGYQLIGDKLHEIIGVIMFVLFITHHILNRHWLKKILKRKYNYYSIIQTITVFLMILTMTGSMVSGVILSRHIFVFLSLDISRSLARTVHHLSAYWGFIIMAFHLGLHWGMILNMFRNISMKKGFIKLPKLIVKFIGFAVAGYGLYSFQIRQIGENLLMLNEYVFFDFTQPKIYFFIDYMAIMGLFVFISYYFMKGIQTFHRSNKKTNYNNETNKSRHKNDKY